MHTNSSTSLTATTSLTTTTSLSSTLSTIFTTSLPSASMRLSVTKKKYEEALENLKQHIDDLANPFLVEDIRQKLSQLCKKPLSMVDGIVDSFSDLILPQQTKNFLQVLNEAILSLGEEDVSHLEETAAKIRVDLQQLADNHAIQEVPSEEFRILFNLPLIKALKNSQIKKIRRFINEKKTEELRDYLLQDCGIKENKADEQVQKAGYSYGFQTLISELIERKLEKNDGIIEYWGRESEFFKDKTLYIHDPDSNKPITGVITKGEHASLYTWRYPWLKNDRAEELYNLCLTLHDKSEVYIPETSFTPMLITKIRYQFWNALNNHLLNQEEAFILEHCEGKNKERCILHDRLYQVSFETNSTTKKIVEKLSDIKNPVSLELLNSAQKTRNYLLVYDSNPTPESSIHVYLWATWYENQGKKPEYIPLNKYSTQDLNRLYYATKIEKKILKGIDKQNANQCIQIKDERDENKLRLIKLKEIKDRMSSLREEFIKGENQKFLNTLIDNLLDHKLTSIDMELLSQNKDCKVGVEEICDKYKKDLNIEYTPSHILKTLVLDSNYAVLVDKEYSVLVSRTMELLKEAHQHVNNMEGKDAILFLGNTGSGKSTAVGHFLGLKMENFVNRVGDRVIRIKASETSDSSKPQPKIGQSLGESETLYTQGFSLSGYPNVILGDCPGFNDTRGGDYEICTNFSIDEAVAKVKAIRSLVLIIPIQAFVMDRANPVIDLIEVVRDRFPNLFELSKNNVFILITKTGQVSPEVADGLRDGTRINELFFESDDKAKDLETKAQLGAVINDFELIGIQRRRHIWQFLRDLHRNKKMHLFNIHNDKKRDEILKQYMQSEGSIDKKIHYVRAMQGREMQMKFGKYIEMATHTWTHSIIDQYLTKFPELIDKHQGEITAAEQKIKKLEIKILNNQIELSTLRESEKQSQEIVTQLQNAVNNSAQLKAKLLADLKKRIQEADDQELKRLKMEVDRLEEQISGDQGDLKEIKKAIKKLEGDLQVKEGRKLELENEIESLKKGAKKVPLWKFKPRLGESISVIKLKNIATRISLFNEMKNSFDPDEIVGYESYSANSYKGTLWHLPKIEKEFRLIPADEEAQKAFRNLGNSTAAKWAAYKVGTYIASVKGEKFAFDLGAKADPTGKTVMYSFTTTWDGKTIPWIEISHQIPNLEINAATIINKSNEIDLLRKEIDLLTQDLHGDRDEIRLGKIKTKNQLELSVTQLQANIAQKKQELADLERQREKEHLSAMLQSQTETHKRIQDDIQAKEAENVAFAQEITNAYAEKEANNEKLQSIKKSKRNLAIVIHEQHETAQQLRDFATLVLGENKNAPIKESAAIVATCENYIKTYDENISKLKEAAKVELGFW